MTCPTQTEMSWQRLGMTEKHIDSGYRATILCRSKEPGPGIALSDGELQKKEADYTNEQCFRTMCFSERDVPPVKNWQPNSIATEQTMVCPRLSGCISLHEVYHLVKVLLFCAILSMALAPRNKWLHRPSAPSEIHPRHWNSTPNRQHETGVKQLLILMSAGSHPKRTIGKVLSFSLCIVDIWWYLRMPKMLWTTSQDMLWLLWMTWISHPTSSPQFTTKPLSQAMPSCTTRTSPAIF